jgi:predicted dehydrogenase
MFLQWLYDSGMQRRQFLMAGAALSALSQSKILGANDRIRLGAIGTGGRCRSLLSALAKGGGNELVAVCDVYETHRGGAKQQFAPDAKEYGDYRQMLDRNDIDAVIIASPDHWHVPMAIDAVKAGKDVYLEKPVTHTVEQGPDLVKAVRDSGRVVQCGMQQRSWEHFQLAAEMISTGKLGKVSLIRTYWFQNYTRRNTPEIDAAKLDWKRWLGSQPEHPFSVELYTTWRWYWDFGGGALTDLFSHWVDVVHWAMASDTPQLAETLGNKYQFTEWDCPDTISAVFQYPNFQVNYEGMMMCAIDDGGLVFRGTEAKMTLDRARLRVFPEGKGVSLFAPEASVDVPSKADGTLAHMANFLESVRSRKDPNAPVEAGVAAARAAHIGNLALRQGRRQNWPV